MSRLTEFIESGILELYASGQASVQEVKEVELMLATYPEVKSELNEINKAIEQYALFNAVEPDPTIKPFLLATIDFMERLDLGEEPGNPPLINEGSKIADYTEWIERKDLQLNVELNEFHAHILANNKEALTAFVWLRNGSPAETHKNLYEKFLVLEGSCDITIGETVHSLVPGDMLSIPLHVSHFVKVTSEIPCKVLLQRIAA